MTKVLTANPPEFPEPAAPFADVIDRALRAAPPIPAPSQLPGYRARQWTEAENVSRLASTLTRCGWDVNREVVVYGDQDRRFRVDLLVRHRELGDICGAIEVKRTDGDFGGKVVVDHKLIVDAVKQASDYVGCVCLATSQPVAWAAVYPIRGLFNVFGHDVPGLDRISVAWVSGLFELASKHLKVHALCHRPHAGLTLMYLNRHVMWDERVGFRATALPMLCGRRQVGGQRL